MHASMSVPTSWMFLLEKEWWSWRGDGEVIMVGS